MSIAYLRDTFQTWSAWQSIFLCQTLVSGSVVVSVLDKSESWHVVQSLCQSDWWSYDCTRCVLVSKHVSFILTVFCTYIACETCQRRSLRSLFAAVLRYSILNLITPDFLRGEQKSRLLPTSLKTFGRQSVCGESVAFKVARTVNNAYVDIRFVISHKILATALNIISSTCCLKETFATIWNLL